MKAPLFLTTARLRTLPLPAVLAALGAAHLLVRTESYGAGIDVDSVFYLSIASNLLAGYGLQDFVGNALLPWPPLFPLLLAGVAFVTGIDPHEAARLVNAAAFGLTIFATGLWLRRTLRSSLLAAAATLVVLTFHYLGHVASVAQTESTFILFSLLALMQIDSYLNRRPARSSLLLAAIWSALAALTRYAGVTLIFACIILLLLHRQMPFPARMKRAVAFAGLSSLPLAAVVTRNRVLFGAWDTPRGDPNLGQSLFDSLRDVALLAGRAVVPEGWPDWLAPVLLTSAVAMVVAGVAAGVRLALRPTGRSWSRSSLTTLGLFVVTYLIFVVAAVSDGRAWDMPQRPLSARLLLPAFVPLVMMAAVALDRLLHLRAAGWRTVFKWVVGSFVLLVGAGNVVLEARTSVGLTIQAVRTGYRDKLFNTAYWDASETIQYLKDNPVETTVHSNSRFGLLHAVLALNAEEVVIGKYRGLPPNLDRLRRWIERTPDSHIVWFKSDSEFGYEYKGTDLRSLPGLTVVADLADGIVLRTGSSSREPSAERQPPIR